MYRLQVTMVLIACSNSEPDLTGSGHDGLVAANRALARLVPELIHARLHFHRTMGVSSTPVDFKLTRILSDQCEDMRKLGRDFDSPLMEGISSYDYPVALGAEMIDCDIASLPHGKRLRYSKRTHSWLEE
jgi:hypothetical protein